MGQRRCSDLRSGGLIAMSWATEDDLIVGDMNLRALDTGGYLDDAENQIIMYLGHIYVLPLPDGLIEDDEGLSRTFKFIQSRLASGTLLMAQAAASENQDLHAYGLHLIQMANEELCRIGTAYELISGDLAAVPKGPTGKDMTPRAFGGDPISITDVFAGFAHGFSTDYIVFE